MSEKFNNKLEAKPESKTAKVEEFKAATIDPETAANLAQEARVNAEKYASMTLDEIKKMGAGEVIKGKSESMPKNDAEKRLYENVGYDSETLAEAKAEFAKLSSAEAYNKFQILSLEKTRAFLANASQNLDSKDRGAVVLLVKRLDATLDAAEANKSGNALRSYTSLMRHCNKTPNGTMAFDGLTGLYAKNGYDNRNILSRTFGSSDVPFENFQNDLAESVLTDEQREDFAKMVKEAEKTAGNTAGAALASGANQRIMMESVFSRQTTDELDKKIAA